MVNTIRNTTQWPAQLNQLPAERLSDPSSQLLLILQVRTVKRSRAQDEQQTAGDSVLSRECVCVCACVSLATPHSTGGSFITGFSFQTKHSAPNKDNRAPLLHPNRRVLSRRGGSAKDNQGRINAAIYIPPRPPTSIYCRGRISDGQSR